MNSLDIFWPLVGVVQWTFFGERNMRRMSVSVRELELEIDKYTSSVELVAALDLLFTCQWT